MSELRLVLFGVAAFIIVYTVLDFNKLYALRYGVDTGAFLQSLVNFAHHGSSFNWVERRPHMTVHDSWTLLFFAPLVAVLPRPETLLILQVVLIASAAVPLWLFARGVGLTATTATLISFAYLISPTAQGVVYENFSENAFVPLLAFSLALAVQHRALWPALLGAQLLMGVKEDQILFLLWFGVLGAIWYDRRLGLAVATLAAVNGCGYVTFEHASGYAASDPTYGLSDQHWAHDLAWFAEVLIPFAFAPLLLGWRVLLAAPLVAEITLNHSWAMPLANIGFHWTIPMFTLMAIAAVLGIRRQPKLAQYALAGSIVMALFFNPTVLHIGRYLFPPDWAAYARARADALSGRRIVFHADDEGSYAVAAGNPNAVYFRRDEPMVHAKPAWVTKATWCFYYRCSGPNARQ
ncbi:MAG: DUF2079 domain-containing protein [Candidatus Eremiobacteraeota bacterium]|nr:DUF2079 domain-containing protein [Candidatus Eremiobacteraeota bacterium]